MEGAERGTKRIRTQGEAGVPDGSREVEALDAPEAAGRLEREDLDGLDVGGDLEEEATHSQSARYSRTGADSLAREGHSLLFLNRDDVVVEQDALLLENVLLQQSPGQFRRL